MNVPSGERLRQLICDGTFSTPVLFSNMIEDWMALKWTPEYMASVLADGKVTCRLGLRDSCEVQWETETIGCETTLQEFYDWLEDVAYDNSQLSAYSRQDYWCYIDYKYMADMCRDHPHLLRAVHWNKFGFSGRSGEDSTMWIGSSGANTVCHYDTYGCNLVAQLYGSKTWVLFPPSDTDYLYSTRVPYEESSVFSEVCIRKPDLRRHPLYANAHPYVITLDPGDVLYVPHHWWHYVESNTASISVNTWIELDVDNTERLKEAVTRTLFYAFAPSSRHDWLNPNEIPSNVEESLQLVQKSLALLKRNSVCADRGMAYSGNTKTTYRAMACLDRPMTYSGNTKTTAETHDCSTTGHTKRKLDTSVAVPQSSHSGTIDEPQKHVLTTAFHKNPLHFGDDVADADNTSEVSKKQKLQNDETVLSYHNSEMQDQSSTDTMTKLDKGNVGPIDSRLSSISSYSESNKGISTSIGLIPKGRGIHCSPQICVAEITPYWDPPFTWDKWEQLICKCFLEEIEFCKFGNVCYYYGTRCWKCSDMLCQGDETEIILGKKQNTVVNEDNLDIDNLEVDSGKCKTELNLEYRNEHNKHSVKNDSGNDCGVGLHSTTTDQIARCDTDTIKNIDKSKADVCDTNTIKNIDDKTKADVSELCDIDLKDFVNCVLHSSVIGHIAARLCDFSQSQNI